MKKKTPPELDRIADKVLAYRPKPKTKAAKRRKRRKQYAERRADDPGRLPVVRAARGQGSPAACAESLILCLRDAR
jgi:hypothetical protein